MLITLYWLSAATLVGASASLSVLYPLDEQLPPIARIQEPFSWSFSPNTFLSDTNASLVYAPVLFPDWLAFDPATRTLSGTPSSEDEGTPEITISATDPTSSTSVSSSLVLCVTPYPPPELSIPVERQFDERNPSLSSVFVVDNTSALYSSLPTLRVPPKWSFSIGFEYGTFSAQHSLYYAARLADGSPPPHWIRFNERAMTLNGVAPHPENISTPYVVPLVLHAADQKGYSAKKVAFNLVVAAHDFSMDGRALPTINVTAAQPFQLSLSSAVDFAGVLIDGLPVSPANITALAIDTSDLESWLRYDPQTRSLSGEPPSDFTKGVLPAVLTSSVNQTLSTEVTISAVPSFFSKNELDPVLVTPGDSLAFLLSPYFSNSTGLGRTTDVELNAAFEPLEASDYLSFDSVSTRLSGNIPPQLSYEHVVVTFTAYSHVTHSTSHTVLPVSLSSSDYANEHDKEKSSGLSTSGRRKLLMGLKIAFGVVCGFVGMITIFALIRRYAHVPDTALDGEEGRRGWTDAEKKWYGIGIEVNGEIYRPPKSEQTEYGWNDGVAPNTPQDGLGATLSRVLTRTLSNVSRSPLSPVGHPQSPGMIKKAEFMSKVRATARIVSDKYRRVVSAPKRPAISKPTLILTDMPAPTRGDIDGLPNAQGLLTVRRMSHQTLQPFDDTAASQYAPSGISSLEGSPSTSTDGRSIPRRRADFAPPKALTTPPAVHLSEHHSVDSLASSVATNSSSRTHEAEAVVQTATRATSVRSAMSGFSFQAEDGRRPVFETARPRLVPFTSATRVPVPKLPSSFFSPDPNVPSAGSAAGGATTKRVVSQMAKVFRSAVPTQPESTTDELRTGMEYVRALGGGGRSSLTVSHAERSPATSAMSFSSVESSNHGHAAAAAAGPPIARVLARAGERFKFRVPLAPGSGKGVEARLISGRALPRFISVVEVGGAEREAAEFWGVPGGADVGEYEIGLYSKDGGRCVGRAVVEVVARRSG